MTQMAMSDVPLEARLEGALSLIKTGSIDPLLALAAAVWPTRIASVQSTEVVRRFCKHGHAMTDDNTRIKGDGYRRCLTCEREANRTRERNRRNRVTEKLPCTYCGAPATSPRDKGTGGLPIPRCRACFHKQRWGK